MFQKALNDIIAKLELAKEKGLLQSYGLIGGLAVAVWGIPRATQDIDFAIALGGAPPQELSQYLGGQFTPGTPEDPLRGVIRLHLGMDDEKIPLQLVFFPSIWSPIIFPSVQRVVIGDCTVSVVSWESLVLLKLYAGGPQDFLDAQTIMATRSPAEKEVTPLRKMAEAVGLAQELENLTET